MTGPIKITIAGELCDLNTYIDAERVNRFNAAKIKKNETARCERAAFDADIELIDEPIEVVFHWFAKDRRKDLDNISFSQKFVFDGLVKAGVIDTDGQRVVTSIAHYCFVDKNNPRVEVNIVPTKRL